MVVQRRKAYSYVRFSTPEQLKGDSLRRQVERTKKYCERNNLELQDLQLQDLGRSAFRGKHRETGALAEFCRLAEDGKIEKGSILIIESLDRLTREMVRTAVKFLIGILDCGIDIVTTNPEYVFKADGSNDTQDIILAVVILSRAHEESATKSIRIREAWNKRRDNIHNKKLSKNCPNWLECKDDNSGFTLIQERVRIVKKLFKLAIDGYGVWSITRKLNAEQVPTLKPKRKRVSLTWNQAAVFRILTSRSVLGEFQPKIRVHENGKTINKPIGKAVPNYYPRIISDDVFNAAKAALKSRETGIKRQGNNVANLFSGLIRDARDGTPYIYRNSRNKCPYALLHSVGARDGTSLPLYFRYQVIEDAFLQFCKEIDPKDIMPQNRQDAINELGEQIKDKESKIDELLEAMDKDSSIPELTAKLAQWKTELTSLKSQLEQLEMEQANNPIETLGTIKELLEETENKESMRIKLKQQIRSLVKEMWLLTYDMKVPGSRNRTKKVRCAHLQIHFKNGNYRSIDMVNETDVEYFAQENSPVQFDIRTYKDMPEKRYDEPIWYEDY